MGSMFVKCPPCPCDEPPFVEPSERWDDPVFIREESFPRRAWDPDVFGLAVLGEFASRDWHARIAIDPPGDSKLLAEEIQALIDLQTLRAGLMPEIRAQNTGYPA